MERKCLPALLFAGIIAPEDRIVWMQSMVRALAYEGFGGGGGCVCVCGGQSDYIELDEYGSHHTHAQAELFFSHPGPTGGEEWCRRSHFLKVCVLYDERLCVEGHGLVSRGEED